METEERTILSFNSITFSSSITVENVPLLDDSPVIRGLLIQILAVGRSAPGSANLAPMLLSC